MSAEYGAKISIQESYTNNLTLAPDEFARSQWVTSVVPSVFLRNSGPRYDIDLDYRLQALFYPGESELNAAYSQFWANGLYDLITDELFVNGFARVTQVNIEPEGRQSEDNINITRNRSDVFAWRVGPVWQRRVLGKSEINASYYVGRVNYDDNDVQGADTQKVQVTLGSLDAVNSFSYNLLYRYSKYDYDDTGPVKFQRIRAEAGYYATPYLQFVGIVGSESNLASNTGVLNEPYWMAGFRNWFGDNRFEAFYGYRFFGPTFRMSWTRTMLRSQFRLRYRESQQTPESAALEDINTDIDAGLDPANDPSLSPDSGISRPGTGIRSITKRFTADYRWTGYKTEARLYAFLREQDQISPDSDQVIDPEGVSTIDKSAGAGFSVKWDIGARTDSSLTGGWIYRKFDTERADGGTNSDIYRAAFRVSYDLGLYTDLSVGIRYRTQRGGTSEFNEFRGSIRVSRYFFGR